MGGTTLTIPNVQMREGFQDEGGRQGKIWGDGRSDVNGEGGVLHSMRVALFLCMSPFEQV